VQPGGLAGDGGPAASATLNNPSGVAVDANGAVYIADQLNNRIRKVAGGTITTVAGTGEAGYNGEGVAAAGASLNSPYSVAVGTSGDLYFADYFNYRIRRISAASGRIFTVAGNGLSGADGDRGPGHQSYISDPTGVALDGGDNVYLVDQASDRIRMVTAVHDAPPGSAMPAVTANPQGQQVGPGAVATFTAAASGNPAPAIQWQVSTDGGSSWTDVEGATSATYALVARVQDNGKRFRALFVNDAGVIAGASAALWVSRPLVRAASDRDGDGRADLTVWRPSSGTWYTLTSSSGFDAAGARATQWGNRAAGDIPLLGDLDGDGKHDLVVWRASTGTWFWLTSSTGYAPLYAGVRQWGNAQLGDVPALADMDGDGRSDLIVWRASTATWFWLISSRGWSYDTARTAQFGDAAAGDVPVPADLDGDGRADLVMWRAATRSWAWAESASGFARSRSASVPGATAEDAPFTGDVDGDGRADLLIWHGTSGTWTWLTSSSEFTRSASVQWGNLAAGDVPLVADMDGDGLVDPLVWRAPEATWYWLSSAARYDYGSAGIRRAAAAAPGDLPIAR
jgi:hypothetical protein